MRSCEIVRFKGTMEVGTCWEPAIAKWEWGGDPLYVCEHHDAEIARKEATERWGNRTELEGQPPSAKSLDPIIGTAHEEGTDGDD